MSKDTCIKANTYCPVHKGIVGADCWHDSKDFSVPRTDWKQVDEINTLREQVEKLENRLNKDSQEFTILCAKETEKVLREQLAALAEQNKQIKAELKSIDGALNDPRANLTLTTSEIIWELKAQVEKLTKERDDLRSRRCEVCGYLEHEREHTGCLREQLAALAEQNEKLKEALEMIVVSSLTHPRVSAYADKALSLPDLTTPVLNRIRAEGMRISTEIHECEDVLAPVGNSVWGEAYQQGWIDGTAKYRDVIHARADELEKQNG